MENNSNNTGVKSSRTTFKILGPGGGGAMYFPTVSPHNPETVLVATDMTGAFITHNGGKSWVKFNISSRVEAFAFDPRSCDIYAGASGVFRSRDNGVTWNLIFPDPAAVVEERMIGDEAIHNYITTDNWPAGKVNYPRVEVILIRVDPYDSDHLFVGLRSDKLHVFFSENRGESWSELLVREGQKIYDIFVEPRVNEDDWRAYVFTDTGIVCCNQAWKAEDLALPAKVRHLESASGGFYPGTGSSVLYITTQIQPEYGAGRLWKSNDCGKTWIDLSQKIVSAYVKPQPGNVVSYEFIDACENEPSAVYLSVYEYPAATLEPWRDGISYGILNSFDEGENWKCVLQGNTEADPKNKICGWAEREYDHSWNMVGPKGPFIMGMGVSPTDPKLCYATDLAATYCTADRGENWYQVYGNEHPDGTLSSRGLDVTTCYGVHFDPFDREHIAVSYTDIGLFHSVNSGRTWSHCMKGIGNDWGNTCYWLVFDPKVKESAWSAWSNAHDLPRTKMYMSGTLGSVTGGIAYSCDGMATWEKSNEGLPECSSVTHLLLDPGSPFGRRILYAAVHGKGVYKSVDNGRSWTVKNNGFHANLNVLKLGLRPDGTLYAVVTRDIENGSVLFDSTVGAGRETGKKVDGAVYRSTDGAESWAEIPMPRQVNGPNDITFDPERPQTLYLSCWPRTIDGQDIFGGAYKSEDGGSSWINILDPKLHVYSITVDPSNAAVLYAITFDEIALRSEDGGRTWKRLNGWTFKWGHRIFVDPYHKDMIYITSSGNSVSYGPACTE